MRKDKDKDFIDDNIKYQADRPSYQSRGAQRLQERMDKRRRLASRGRLISYIIALVGIILLMIWLRQGM